MSQVNIQLTNDAGASFGAVSGVDATKTAGTDDRHATFTLRRDQVGDLARRCRGGLVLRITDDQRRRWHCAEPKVEGETIVAECERQGGGE